MLARAAPASSRGRVAPGPARVPLRERRSSASARRPAASARGLVELLGSVSSRAADARRAEQPSTALGTHARAARPGRAPSGLAPAGRSSRGGQWRSSHSGACLGSALARPPARAPARASRPARALEPPGRAQPREQVARSARRAAPPRARHASQQPDQRPTGARVRERAPDWASRSGRPRRRTPPRSSPRSVPAVAHDAPRSPPRRRPRASSAAISLCHQLELGPLAAALQQRAPPRPGATRAAPGSNSERSRWRERARARAARSARRGLAARRCVVPPAATASGTCSRARRTPYARPRRPSDDGHGRVDHPAQRLDRVELQRRAGRRSRRTAPALRPHSAGRSRSASSARTARCCCPTADPAEPLERLAVARIHPRRPGGRRVLAVRRAPGLERAREPCRGDPLGL